MCVRAHVRMYVYGCGSQRLNKGFIMQSILSLPSVTAYNPE